MPGADLGLQRRGSDHRRAAQAARATPPAQFGKNHLGDRDEFLPTNHGFDEFFGNLYHLNAEEEPEHPGLPEGPGVPQRFGPRGVHPQLAMPDGTQIEDTGPLTKKRMETIDDEVTDARSSSSRSARTATSRSSSGGTRPTCTSAPT